jgi:hypothetical protein
MAEGLLEGILGGDGEKPEIEAPEALAGAEAFATAVAAKLSGSDPEVARDTSAFLKEQTQLLRVQKEHLKDEHALRIAHLRNQLSDESLRAFGLRLRVGFQIFLLLVATVIGVGAAVMIRDAVASRSIVVDTFDVSPSLAAQTPEWPHRSGGPARSVDATAGRDPHVGTEAGDFKCLDQRHRDRSARDGDLN